MRRTASANPSTDSARCVNGSVRCPSMPSWATTTSGRKARRTGGRTASNQPRQTARGGEGQRHGRVERIQVDRVVGVGVQRQVHRVPAPGTLADLLDGAGPREEAV